MREQVNSIQQQIMKQLEAWNCDTTALHSRFLDDTDMYFSCLQILMEDRDAERLAEAIGRKDFRTAFDAVHSIKGSSGTLGLTPLYEKAAILSDDFRDEVRSGWEKNYADFRDVWEKFISIMG